MSTAKRTITIEGTAEIFYAGLIEDDTLVEYHRYSLTEPLRVGQILKGQVQRETGTVHSYFVDLGLDKPGFWNAGRKVSGGSQPVLQIEQEGKGRKGYRVTERYTLPGHYLVLTPFDHRVHISLRIDDPQAQERLRALAARLPGEGRFGWIFRTEALRADSDAILEEATYLYDLYASIENKAITAPVGAILFAPVHPLVSFLRSAGITAADSIVCGDKELMKQLVQLPGLPQELIPQFRLFDQGRFNISDFYKITSALTRALKREVPLKDGGSIVIDETEALVVIDVNSGGTVFHGQSREDSIFKVNAKACPVIAEQIRLRNLSGIIIVDFIDMKRDSDREKLLQLMKEQIKKDRQRVTIHGYTHLGLMEISRKREDLPLSTILPH